MWTRVLSMVLFVLGLFLLAIISPPTRIDGSCNMAECDEIAPLLDSFGTTECLKTKENNKTVAYGWSKKHATDAKMFSRKAIANVDPSEVDPTEEIAQYRSESPTICTGQCNNVYPMKGITSVPKGNWEYQTNVKRTQCTLKGGS